MGEGFQFLDIILLAMVAGFVLLRLRSVLGRRTGHEQRRPQPAPRPAEDKVVPLPERKGSERAEAAMKASGPAAAGLTRIQVADRSFDPAEFVSGAKGAYEMIVTGFAGGNLASLRGFLSDEVYGGFERALAERKAAGHTQETTLVSMKSADIVEADLKDRSAEVTVKFVSELVNVTRDAKGEVVAGNPSAVEEVTDIWTFARDTRSSDPNWTLTGTSAPA